MSNVLLQTGAQTLAMHALAADRAVARAVDSADVMSPADRARIEAAAEQFEAFFIAQLLRQMRNGVRELAGEDDVRSSRANQDMLDMADTLFADSLATQRAFGIADLIIRQLLPSGPPPAASLKSSLPPVAHED